MTQRKKRRDLRTDTIYRVLAGLNNMFNSGNIFSNKPEMNAIDSNGCAMNGINSNKPEMNAIDSNGCAMNPIAMNAIGLDTIYRVPTRGCDVGVWGDDMHARDVEIWGDDMHTRDVEIWGDDMHARDWEKWKNRTDGHIWATQAGFSLTELMVVLVIIGILALLALPRFTSITTKAKTAEAKRMLSLVHTLQESYRLEYDVYAQELAQTGYEQTLLIPDGGTARYRITVENADASSFVVLATSVVDFDKDGVFNVWQVDQTGKITERTPD